MSGVQEFFAGQRALAEMSDEDIDEYETRTRGARKRRKLWDSDENPAGSSQGVSRDVPPVQRGRCVLYPLVK
ncbi:hypothetical protein M0805_003926 [Coniferiporia weirii]|nr:hypothetical protein M0805_003926 [Coniferiporia weirii]